MNITFRGKRALVTGAGKGIGRAVVLKLAECGADVVALSRTQSDLDSLKSQVPGLKTVCVDVGEWSHTKKAIDGVGAIDLLVNNAAIMPLHEYGNISEKEIDSIFNINVKSVINITQTIAEGMKSRGKGGSIVNLSSMMALYTFPSYGVYCASKGAVDQLTRSMALEYGPHQIRVNSVNPTVVRTDLTVKVGIFDESNEAINLLRNRTPLRRFCEVEDIVGPILFLLSDKSGMISGITLPVDGGNHVLF